jgi:uncharacterized protein YbjT (DUF2867 family)
VKVLVVGASGFIGRQVARTLEGAGHAVVRALRRPRSPAEVAADFSRDCSPDAWLPRLAGIDAVVNAAGIFREQPGSRFAAIHDEGPRALFAACQAAGTRVVVQISALGADDRAASRFHLSKRNADAFLRASSLDWCIVQPSVVFGPGGSSSRLLAMLAAMPVVPLPGDGLQRVQPVHVEDLSALVLHVLENPAARRRMLAAVGPRPVTLREWLATLRAQMGFPATLFVPVPLPLVRLVSGREAVEMLCRGNTASPVDTQQALGRDPRPIEQFLADEATASGVTDRARLAWLLPLLRATVALTWIATGIVSFAFPKAESLAMLGRVGLAGVPAEVALYGAAVLDLALGTAVYAVKQRRWVWRAQFALIAAYSAIIAVFLPEFWLHPFGPVLKNVPLLAAILLLHEFEPRERWTT